MSYDSDPSRHGRGEPISETAAGNADLGSDQEPKVLLRVVAGARAGEFIPLKVGVTRVGRAAGNDLVLDSGSVSRYHARIVADEQGLLVFDQSATNPTRIGNRIVREPTAAEHGDIITIGDTMLEVLEVDATTHLQHLASLVDEPGGPVDAQVEPDHTVDMEIMAGRTIELTVYSEGVPELHSGVEVDRESPFEEDQARRVDPVERYESQHQPTAVLESTMERIQAALLREVVVPRSLVLRALHVLNPVLILVILILIARLLGGSAEADAFYAAEGLVDLILVGSAALSMVVLSMYRRRWLIAGNKTAADRLLWTLTLSIGLVLALLATFASLFAPQVARLLVPGFSETTELTVELVQVALLGLVVVAFDAALHVLLHANRSSTTTELARLLANMAVISAIILFAPAFGPGAIMAGVVGGLVLITIVQAVVAASLGLLVKPTFNLNRQSKQALLRLPGSLFLMVWPLGILLVDRSSASRLGDGSVAALGYGGWIALAILGIGLSTLAERGHLLPIETEEGRSFTAPDRARSIHTALAILVPLAVIVYLTRFDLVDLLLGRGAFGPDEVLVAGTALGGYALGLPGFAFVMFVGAALAGGRPPSRLVGLSVAALVLTALLDAAVIDRWGLAGLALTSSGVISVVAMVNVIVLAESNEIVIERRMLLGQLVRIVGAVTVAAIAASLVSRTLTLVGIWVGARLVLVGLTVAVVYGAIGWVVEVDPIRSAFDRWGKSWRAAVDRKAWSSVGPSARAILVGAATVLVAIIGALVIGAALAVIGGRLAGLERLMLGAAIVALPMGVSLRSRQGFDRTVFFAFLIFGVVYLEPAPVDGLLAVLLAAGVLQGRLDLNRLWAALPVVVAVGVMLAISFIAGMRADAPILSLRFNIVTVYCVAIMCFVRMYCISTETVDRVIRAYIIGGVVAVLAALAGLMGFFSGIDMLEGGRIRGFTQDANVFGPFLVVGMFLAIDQIRRPDLSMVTRRMFAAAAVISAVGIFLTFSRAAWGNTVLTALVYLVLAGRTFSRRERVRAVGLLFAISFLLVVSTLVTGQVDLLIERASVVQSYDNERFAAQREGILFGLNNPLGIGPGMTDFGDRFAPHNGYIRSFAETGLAGLLALIAVYWSLVYPVARRVRISSRFLGVSSQVLVAVMIGQLANGLLIDTLHWRHLWFLLGLMWIQHDRLRDRGVDRRQEERSPVGAGRLGVLT